VPEVGLRVAQEPAPGHHQAQVIYRYLAYLQQQAGYPVKTDMPGLTGPEVERLYERGAAWLAGQPVAP
jgi:hypothetical protein